MKRKNFEGFSCDDLIKMLDEHISDGWSQTSFPSKINMTFSTFHCKKNQRPKFASYYESKRPRLRKGLYKHGLSSYLDNSLDIS